MTAPLRRDFLFLDARPTFASLTPRQRDVLPLLVAGKSTKQIARELGIAYSTVRIHLAGLYRALGVRNRVEAAVAGMRLASQEPTGG